MKYLRAFYPYVPYAFLALLVIGPLLIPGFVLTMDMVMTPVLRMPNHVDNTWVFYAVLHLLNLVLPADLLQKIMLLGIFWGSGVGAHRLLQVLRPADQPYWRWAQYAAGTFYMVNPFVYDRFMSGQYGVLLGYALLPWFARSLYGFVYKPHWMSALRLSGWLVAISNVSIHSVGLALLMMVVAVGMYARDKKQIGYAAAALGVFVVLSSYWLVPTVLGQGRIAESLPTFTSSERQAFATVDAVGTGPLGAVLGMQGFWQETRGLYTQPIEANAVWGFVQLLFFALVAAGIAAAWRAQRQLAMYGVVVGVVSVCLAVGLGSGWLAAHVPFFAGYREPQKFVALLALVYVYFVAWGAASALGFVAWRVRWGDRIALIVLLLLPLSYTPTMLWGMNGQIRTANYPADWSIDNQLLQRQPGSGKVLVLPWHLYMRYGFTHGRIIASPAKGFFDREVVVSDDPEIAGVVPQVHDATREAVQQTILPSGTSGQQIAPQLGELGIGYVLLFKDLDYGDYAYLDKQAGLKLLQDSQTIRLYGIVK
jgi:hypothetical protein